MQYREKPVVIEAIRASEAIQAAQHDWNALPQWLRDAYEANLIVFDKDYVEIVTRAGPMRADPDDWINRGTMGELYSRQNDSFETTYEPVEPEAASEDWTV